MKYVRVKILVIGAVTGLCLLTACGQKGGGDKPSAGAVVTAEPAVTAIPEEGENPRESPVAMEQDTLETPSGVKVEPKFQKYKVVQGANIRSDCDGSSEWKGSLFGGEILQGTGVCENGWVQIIYNGERCYVTGGCLEETDEGQVVTGSDAVTPMAAETPSPAAESMEPPSATEAPETEVKVSDWAKYKSTEWEADDETSCYLRFFSVAGNEVIFTFTVIDGSLDSKDNSDAIKAEVKNCNGKIENGVLNFSFTDSFGNEGVGNVKISDDSHLSISTVISQPNPEAAYRAEIMTELTEIDD